MAGKGEVTSELLLVETSQLGEVWRDGGRQGGREEREARFPCNANAKILTCLS